MQYFFFLKLAPPLNPTLHSDAGMNQLQFHSILNTGSKNFKLFYTH